MITIDSIELVDDTMNFLRSEYTVTPHRTNKVTTSLNQSIRLVAMQIWSMAALFASLLVVGFVMVIITRVNEIGVLKAIGLKSFNF